MSSWHAELWERGRTWNSEIAAVRLPNTQWSDEGGGRGRERRFLGHGGLLINLRNGAWYSHSHRDGGYSPLGLLAFVDAHCQPDRPLADKAERVQWLLAWLTEHEGTGPCDGTLEDGEGAAAEGASRSKAEGVLHDLVQLDHPDAEPARIYFGSRKIPVPDPLPDWYSDVVGYLPNARVGEGAIVSKQRTNQRIVGVNLRFIDALGKKSAVSPAFARYKLEAGATGVMEFPAAPGVTLTETIIAEGLEDCLSVRRVCGQPIVGLVDVGVWRELAPIAGQVLIVRDGDIPGSAADMGLQAGIDRLLFAGRVRPEIRCTRPGPGEDANALLQTQGEAALAKLLEDARTGELAQPSYEAEVEFLATLTSEGGR
jgi:hypothetical protein